jgi:hypothetical protein
MLGLSKAFSWLVQNLVIPILKSLMHPLQARKNIKVNVISRFLPYIFNHISEIFFL